MLLSPETNATDGKEKKYQNTKRHHATVAFPLFSGFSVARLGREFKSSVATFRAGIQIMRDY